MSWSRIEKPGSADVVSMSAGPRFTIEAQPSVDGPVWTKVWRLPASITANAVTRVEPRLDLAVIGQARHCDFDDKRQVLRARLCKGPGVPFVNVTRNEHEVWTNE